MGNSDWPADLCGQLPLAAAAQLSVISKVPEMVNMGSFVGLEYINKTAKK